MLTLRKRSNIQTKFLVPLLLLTDSHQLSPYTQCQDHFWRSKSSNLLASFFFNLPSPPVLFVCKPACRYGLCSPFLTKGESFLTCVKSFFVPEVGFPFSEASPSIGENSNIEPLQFFSYSLSPYPPNPFFYREATALSPSLS